MGFNFLKVSFDYYYYDSERRCRKLAQLTEYVLIDGDKTTWYKIYPKFDLFSRVKRQKHIQN